MEREWEREQELGLEQEQEREREFMIPLLLILLSGVAWGEVPYSPDPYNPTYPVDIIEQNPTYVVVVSSGPACPKNPLVIPEPHCGEQLHTLRLYKNDYSGSWRCYGPMNDCEWLYDLAESLNEAHRRRVK